MKSKKPPNLSMRDYFKQCHNCPYNNDPSGCENAQIGGWFCQDFIKIKTKSYKITKIIEF